MTTSSYGHNENSAGNVNVLQELSDNIEGYDVLIVDDIIDTGITMNFVMEYFKKV